MKQIIIRETQWEIRFQDGPAENGIYYDTEQKALDELSTWADAASRGACVRPVVREYPWQDALTGRFK